MNLELKHLSPYLPFGLKIKTGKNVIRTAVLELKLPEDARYEITATMILGGSIRHKPILRPLSDLTTEIMEGESFKYLGEVKYCQAFTMDEKQVGILAMPYYVLEKLFKGRFDVFDLIEKGLAISIHDVEQADA